LKSRNNSKIMKNEWRVMKSLVFLVAGVMLFSCATSEDDPVNTENKANSVGSYKRYTAIYDTLSIEGDFVAGIGQYKLVLENALSQTFEFDLIEPSSDVIKIFIPKDFKSEKYSVLLKKGSATTTLADHFSEPVEVYVRKRPVILTASATSFKSGASIVLTGENFSNTSGNTSYNPSISIMSLGYSNSVSTVTVNTAGTTANITISKNLNPGKYQLFLTTDNGNPDSYEPWSNPVDITIIP
jgi:hypothetical protein